MNNYEQLVEKVAEWAGNLEYAVVENRLPNGSPYKHVPTPGELIVILFTPAQIEALKQGGDVVVTTKDQAFMTAKAFLVGFALRIEQGQDPMYDKVAERLEEEVKAANFRKVVTG